MNLQTIEQALAGLSLTDLRQLNASVVDAIKFKRNQDGNSIKRTLSVGDTVEFTNNDGATQNGKIIKKNRTRAVVELKDDRYDGSHSLPRHKLNQRYTIPFSMLRLAKAGGVQ